MRGQAHNLSGSQRASWAVRAGGLQEGHRKRGSLARPFVCSHTPREEVAPQTGVHATW